MTPEHRGRVERVCSEALECEPSARGAYLVDACAGDEELLREVESLLAREARANGFLDSSPYLVDPAPVNRVLQPGLRLGPYLVLELIGAGGMGEVYRAQDTNLGRDVAIKVLPEAFAQDPERLARFEREAKTLASLNHPNIAIIHGLERAGGGGLAIVMELVEGPTLADRIAQGPIPVDEALPIAKQIAGALEGAHEQGIIHRDLKPANIKLRPDGTVKVLDFGLAKALEPAGLLSSSQSMSSRIATPTMTQMGMILGTAAYMSPEQAKGKPADKRSDVWAFGCVLYEMLTRNRAFGGEEVTDTLAAVLRADVDWTQLPHLHPRLVEVLKRCLRKDPGRRLRDIGDLRIELDEVSDDPEGVSLHKSITGVPARPFAVAWYGLAVTMSALLAIAVTWYLGATGETLPVTRFVIDLAVNQTWTSNLGVGVSISPDGRHVAYTATNAEGIRQLYLQPLSAYTSEPIARSEGAYHPFFSPDSRQLAFFASGSIRRVAVTGGNPIEITRGIDELTRGATWAGDGFVYFGGASGISRVAASGGVPEVVTTQQARWPEAIPSHGALLFTVFSGDLETSRIAVLSLQTHEWKVLLDEAGYHARYASTGHVVYLRGNTMMAVPFDADRLEITGVPQPVLDGVAANIGGAAHFRFSDNGTLAYVPGHVGVSSTRTLSSSPVWVDANGHEEAIGLQPGLYTDPAIAPDGTRVAMTVADEAGSTNIRIWDLNRRNWTVLTEKSSETEAPVWTLDARRIVFSGRNGRFNHLYMQRADGVGEARRLSRDDGGSTVGGSEQSPRAEPRLFFRIGWFPTSVSSDGRWLFLVESRPKNAVGIFPLEGEGLPRRLFEGDEPRLSPNRRWLAYRSGESGSSQIYVRPFPDVEATRWTVSRDGANGPRWSSDGRALYYRSGNQMMRVQVADGDVFSFGSPETLFDTSTYLRGHDLAPDGRFLMLRRTDNDASGRPHVVLNWFEELQRLVPTR